MTLLLTIIHVVVCVFLIVIVLLQHGKGADIGATFGGSSQAIFGAEGPLPLLNKITTGSAIIFMITSLTLAYLSSHKANDSVMSDIKPQTATSAPVSTAPVATTQPAQQQQPLTVPMPTAGNDAAKSQTPATPAQFPAETGRSH